MLMFALLCLVVAVGCGGTDDIKYVSLTFYTDANCDGSVLKFSVKHPLNNCVASPLGYFAMYEYDDANGELKEHQCRSASCKDCGVGPRDVEFGHDSCDADNTWKFDVVSGSQFLSIENELFEFFHLDTNEVNGVGTCGAKTLSTIFHRPSEICTNVSAGVLNQYLYMQQKMLLTLAKEKMNLNEVLTTHSKIGMCGKLMYSERITCVRGNPIWERFINVPSCESIHGMKVAVDIGESCQMATFDTGREKIGLDVMFHSASCVAPSWV